MPSLYGSAGGVNRKLRELYARDSGGTTRKLRELWGRDAGAVSRKVFSGAVIWTNRWYTKSGSPDDYGLSDTLSVWMTMAGGSNSARGGYEYIFSEPLLLPAGSVITAKMWSNTTRTCHFYVNLEDNEIISYSMSIKGGPEIQTYTISGGISVPYISCDLSIIPGASESINTEMAVSIKLPDRPEFLLNNSGSSDQ